MADADGEPEYEPADETDAVANQRRAWIEPCDGRGAIVVADAAHMRREKIERKQPNRIGEFMGDTDDAGLEGRSGDVGERTDEFDPWPPGPTEHEKWKCIDPQLKPAVCRVAHGVANRVDRLRLCGNGVVPLAAAYAFRTLARAAGIETGTGRPL